MLTLERPSYLYLIECVALGLFYIGTRKEKDFETDAEYMSSSRLCKALQREFSEHHWEKHLLGVFDTYAECVAVETTLILAAKADGQTGLINLSANNVADFWEFLPTHLSKADLVRVNKVKARSGVQPLVNGHHMNLVLVKKADGTAHAPCMPRNDMTPHPHRGNWPTPLLQVYNDLPPGYYHFCTQVTFRENGQKRYLLKHLVESFETEEQARAASSRLSKLPKPEYDAYVNARLEKSAKAGADQ